MRANALSLLTAIAIGGFDLVTAEDVERPRYLPREVKRVITNGTLSTRSTDNSWSAIWQSIEDSLTAQPSITTPAVAPASTEPAKQVIVVISSDANGQVHTLTTSTEIISAAKPTATPATTVKTDTTPNDITNAGTGSTSSSSTPSNDSSAAASNANTSKPASTTSDSLLGQVGSGVSNLLGLGTTSSTSTPPGSSANPSADSSALSSANPSANSTASSTASSAASRLATSDAATTTGDSLLGALGSDVSNLLGATSTPAVNASSSATESKGPASTPSSTFSPTSSQGSLLESLGISIPAAETATASSTTPTGSSTISISVPAVSPTASPTSTGGDLLSGVVGGLTSGLGSLLPNATETASAETSSTGTGIGVIPTPVLPTSTSIPRPSIPLISSASTATSTAVIPTPHLPGSGSSVSTGSASIPTPIATQETSRTPTASVALPTTTTEPASTSETVSTSTPEPATTKTPEEPSTSNTNNWIPSSILVLPTSTSSETTSTGTQTNANAKPTTLPGSITPNDGVTEAPSDSVLLQLGFDGHLPWTFVATTPLSSSQIFEYIPLALKNAMPNVAATMWALEPYYSWQTTGYNATLAIFYFPRDKVPALQDLKRNPISALYQNADESVKTLMSMIDPSIPLEFAGNYPASSGSSPSDSSSDPSSNGGSTEGTSNTDGSANSSKAKASSVGIGVGVVAGAAAYGAGMFWVARRYRKRKQLHKRSSSTADQMSQGSGSIFAAGGRMSGSQRTGRSGQVISAPVMAENSLGWN